MVSSLSEYTVVKGEVSCRKLGFFFAEHNQKLRQPVGSSVPSFVLFVLPSQLLSATGGSG